MFQSLKKSVASLAAWVIACLFVLGCVCFDRGSSGKPLPAEYIGFWKGSDGSTFEIAGNGSVNFKQGNVEYKGASLEVDESGKVLRMKLLGFEVRSFTINQPPRGGRMVLDNITYTRRNVTEKDQTEEGYRSRNFPRSANDGDYLSEKRAGEDPGISESEMIYLLTETILDFNKAIQAEDFSDFLQFRCSRPFRQQYTSDELISSFYQFVQQKEAVGMVLEQVAEVSPSFSHKFVKSGGNDVLKIKGSFNTTPNKTYFDNEYLLEDGEWKLIKIEIQLK